jgi:hypothetical protein
VWLRSNEEDVRGIVDAATDEFDDILLDDLEGVFETAWGGENLSEGNLVDPTVVQQGETYDQVHKIFDDTGGASPWSQLQDAGRELSEEHPDSPTTEAVETALASSWPPTARRVHQLIEESQDPKRPDTGGETWSELQRVAERLKQDLPNADITDKVTTAVEAESRPTDERAIALLEEAMDVLERLNQLQEELDELESGSIVIIDKRG